MNQTIYPSGHVVLENPPAVVVSAPSGRIISLYRFLKRFTFPEMGNVLRAAKTDTDVESFMLLLRSTKDNDIDLDDPQTIGGIDTLIAKGLIDPSRRADFLA